MLNEQFYKARVRRHCCREITSTMLPNLGRAINAPRMKHCAVGDFRGWTFCQYTMETNAAHFVIDDAAASRYSSIVRRINDTLYAKLMFLAYALVICPPARLSEADNCFRPRPCVCVSLSK